jgi:anti-sigma factor RsiW
VEVTDVTHPSVEEVSLHLEGVLDPGDEQRVRRHLEQCAECASTAQELHRVTEQVHAAGEFSQSSQPVPPVPAEVAARVESALAQEASGRGVVDLAQRRRRRRRVLSGGLLAAAAATVVAVGLGQLMQSGGAGDAAGGTAGSVVAQQQTAPRRNTPRGGPEASALGDDGQGRSDTGLPQEAHERGLKGPDTLSLPAPPRDVALIEGVAAAHSPDRPQHDLPGCVRSALGSDLGPVASYAVRLPGGGGAPGVVVLRPSRAPTEGVLVDCRPQPHVLARRGLHP